MIDDIDVHYFKVSFLSDDSSPVTAFQLAAVVQMTNVTKKCFDFAVPVNKDSIDIGGISTLTIGRYY